MSLLRRKESSKQRLGRLLSESGLPAGSIFLELALGHPRASEHVATLLRSRELGERMTAMVALQLFGTQRDVEAVWQNLGCRDSRYYARDVRLRYLSLSALIHELNRTDGVRAAPTW
jgi:hypothetical protein